MPRGKQLVTREGILLSDAIDKFTFKNKAKGLAAASIRQYEVYANDFMRYLGDKYVADITLEDIDNYMVYKREGGMKPTSVKTSIRHLKCFFNFCADRGYRPPMKIEVPKCEDVVKVPYTPEEMQKLLSRPRVNNFVAWRSWAMVNYFYSTGQRLSTVRNIKVSDLDLDQKKVLLTWNKDKQQKYMPLSTSIVAVLREWLKISQLSDADYLFPEYEGGCLSVRGAEDAIIKYNTERGVSKTSIHLFRHTFAREYIVNGGNPAKLQKLLNHKTIAMTMKYVQLYSDDLTNELDLYNPLDTFKRKNKSMCGDRRRTL